MEILHFRACRRRRDRARHKARHRDAASGCPANAASPCARRIPGLQSISRAPKSCCVPEDFQRSSPPHSLADSSLPRSPNMPVAPPALTDHCPGEGCPHREELQGHDQTRKAARWARQTPHPPCESSRPAGPRYSESSCHMHLRPRSGNEGSAGRSRDDCHRYEEPPAYVTRHPPATSPAKSSSLRHVLHCPPWHRHPQSDAISASTYPRSCH